MTATISTFSLAIVALVSVAGAQSIEKWKTPNRQLYFGDKPPAGSTLLGETQGMGTSGGGDNQRGKLGAAPAYSWLDNVECRDLTFSGVSSTPYLSFNEQTIRGMVTHSGRNPVKNIRVCGGGVCTVVRNGTMEKGESAECR